MATSSTSITKIAGIALLIIGLGLVYWGYQNSGAIGSQISETFTGSPTDKVMSLYISGAARLVVGLYLSFRK